MLNATFDVLNATFDVLNATFDAACLDTFCRLDELGLEAIGQRLDPGRAVLLPGRAGA